MIEIRLGFIESLSVLGHAKTKNNLLASQTSKFNDYNLMKLKACHLNNYKKKA